MLGGAERPSIPQVHLLGRICDWRGWDDHFRKARSLIDSGMSAGIGPIFALAYPLNDDQLCAVSTLSENFHTAIMNTTPCLQVARSRAQDVLQKYSLFAPYFTPWTPQYNEPVEKMAIAVSLNNPGFIFSDSLQSLTQSYSLRFCLLISISGPWASWFNESHN